MSKQFKRFPYPLNLWSDVLDKAVSAEELPGDWEPALDHVLSTLKTEKEREILLHYYKDGLSLSATGDLYEVTSERIRQQMNAAIRRLRYPARKVFFLYGWKDGLTAAEQIVAEREKWDKNRVDDLGLSVRAWNCLIRAGVDTVDKLQQCTEEDLSQMRNMGKKSVDEIKAKLALRGLSLRRVQLDKGEKELLALDLSVRAYNSLMRAKVDTIDKLLLCTEEDLRRMRGMGELNVQGVKKKLAQHGMSLHEPETN